MSQTLGKNHHYTSSQEKCNYFICKTFTIAICTWLKANPDIESHNQGEAWGPGNHGKRSWGLLSWEWDVREGGDEQCRLHWASINLFRWAYIMGPHCSQRPRQNWRLPRWDTDTEIILMDTHSHLSSVLLAFPLSLVSWISLIKFFPVRKQYCFIALCRSFGGSAGWIWGYSWMVLGLSKALSKLVARG